MIHTKMNKLNTISLCLVLFIISAAAVMPKDNTKRLKKEAEFFFFNEDYVLAEPLFKKLTKIYPKKKEYKHNIGVCLLNIRNRERESLPFLEGAMTQNHDESFYYGAQAYHINLRLEEAIDCLDIYQGKGKHLKTAEEIEVLREKILYTKQLMANPIGEKPILMSKAINSKAQEYAPLINKDGTALYFTARKAGSTGGLTDPNGSFYEDVYVSHKVGDKWSKSKPIAPPVNTGGHDANVSFSANGETLIIYRTEADLQSGNLLYSIRTKNGWSDPVEYSENINSIGTHEPSACLSFDEDYMLLVSNRDGSYGGKDLFMVRKLPDGTWSIPKNLGDVINSDMDEESPFLSADGKRLYFSSNGHNSIGGFDIFYSELDDEGNWMKPVNMGFPINTVSDDIYFTSTQDGTRGYFSSSRSGNMDIYAIDMLFEANDLVVVKGFVKDELSQKTLSAYVALEEKEDLDNLSAAFTNNYSGKFLLVVKPNKKYNLVVEAPGYTDYKEEITLNVDHKGDFMVLSKVVKLKKMH
ncbi:MAG: hypothetical protein ACI8XB_001071 [Patiriisocius sp.]